MTTILSPSATPLLTSTKPSPVRPALISRGSKRPVAEIQQDDLAVAVVDDGACRHRDDVLVGAGRDLDVAVHVRQQREVGVRQLDTHPHRARFLHQMRIDNRYGATERCGRDEPAL